MLDGEAVDAVHADLTARRGDAGTDLTAARRLRENAGVAFMGDTKGGPFDVSGVLAAEWLRLLANPNGRPNSDVLKPWANGMGVTRRPSGKGLAPDVPASDYADDPRAVAIANAARSFVTLRDRWLNPPEWVEWVEVAPGIPKHPLPRDDDAANELKRRTLTRLYNARPQWLDDAHAELDAAVAAAYGLDAGIGAEERSAA